jgi:hypothetical protein
MSLYVASFMLRVAWIGPCCSPLDAIIEKGFTHMPMTKSEVMYLSVGLAVGGMVGANWSKVKPLLDSLLGSASEGLGDAYGDLVGSLASQIEAYQDKAAERSSGAATAPAQNGAPEAAQQDAAKQPFSAAQAASAAHN